ncbi:MAG: hypothetical protein E7128_04300 [Rikenellaceae bacterium]|nr:hypothetical protein [Rikenellaceae bacterium]
MRKLVLSFIFVLSSSILSAQTGSVVGRIIDSATNEAILGAVVEFLTAKDSTSVKAVASGNEGAFSSSGIKAGDYILRVRYLGYESPDLAIKVGRGKTDLGDVKLKAGIAIETVVKEVEALRTTQNGDTLIYNADAYKVAADATVEGLLKKMPGVEVSGGEVKAQGESIKKVLVDGKEFYGENVSSAISTLPADAVKSIEVFDKMSDNAEFTKMDDGEGYKAINIVTKVNVRKGQYGQFSGLYGLGLGVQNRLESYAMLGGYINIHNNDARIGINTMVNNMNLSRFTENDLLGAIAASGGSGGIRHVGNFGLNYNDTWGKKDNISFSGNYGFNISNSRNEQITERDYFSDSITQNLYSRLDKIATSNMLNYNHNFSANIKAKWDKVQLRIRPSFSYQYNTSQGASTTTYTPTNSIDDLAKEILQSHSNRLNDGWNAGLDINYNQKITDKPGRALTISLGGYYSKNNGDGYSLSQTKNLPDSIGMNSSEYGDFFKNQKWLQNSYNYNLRGTVTYSEPLTNAMQLSLNYEVNYRYSDADRRTYLGEWNPSDSTWLYSVNFSPEYSNTQNSGYLINRVGPGYNYSKDGTRLNVRVFYQNAILTGQRQFPQAMNLGSRSFNNVTYSANFRYKIDKQNSFRIRLNSSTVNPSITNLQDVVNLSNVQAISRGNANLQPEYTHVAYIHYIRSNIEKGRTFMIGGGASLSQNSIVNRVIRNSPGYVVTDPVTGAPLTTLTSTASFSMPINMNGKWNVHGMVNFGMPLSFMKCNLNIGANIGYEQSPTVTGVLQSNGEVQYTKNISKRLSPGGMLTIGSNISENVDFSVGYRVNYNNVRNTFNLANNNDYLAHSAWGNVKVVLPLGFTIASDVSYTQNFGLSGSDFNVAYTLWNFSIGKKLFRNNRGEINLFVNDILDQNRSFQRRWSALYLENVTNTSIGRYVGISMTYNLRNYGGKMKGPKDVPNFESLRDGGGRAPMGPPPGGFGGRRPM